MYGLWVVKRRNILHWILISYIIKWKMVLLGMFQILYLEQITNQLFICRHYQFVNDMGIWKLKNSIVIKPWIGLVYIMQSNMSSAALSCCDQSRILDMTTILLLMIICWRTCDFVVCLMKMVKYLYAFLLNILRLFSPYCNNQLYLIIIIKSHKVLRNISINFFIG